MNKKLLFLSTAFALIMVFIFRSTSFAFTAIPTIKPLHFENNINTNSNINTGDATSEQRVTNIIDTHYECNCTPTPTQGQQPSSTPTPTPTTPSNNNGGGSGGSGEGSSSSSSSTPAQAVLGLSTTDSENNLYFSFFQILAAGTLAFAGAKKIKFNK